MSDDTDSRNDDSSTEQSTSGEGEPDRQYVAFVDGVKLGYDDPVHEAREILERAGKDPNDLALVALKGESGKEVATFQDSEQVDFRDKHRKHFDVDGKGGGYV
jgi:hypothetical protein